MKKAVVVQHHRFETLGSNFGSILSELGYEIETVSVFEGEPDFVSFDAPDLGEVDIIIALGGPMSANDGYPALRQEMEYLRTAADAGKSVLGICLGAQLLSRALGGVVEPTGARCVSVWK